MARKQRQITAQLKRETVLETQRGEKPIAQICRQRQLTDSLVYKRRQRCNMSRPSGQLNWLEAQRRRNGL